MSGPPKYLRELTAESGRSSQGKKSGNSGYTANTPSTHNTYNTLKRAQQKGGTVEEAGNKQNTLNAPQETSHGRHKTSVIARGQGKRGDQQDHAASPDGIEGHSQGEASKRVSEGHSQGESPSRRVNRMDSKVSTDSKASSHSRRGRRSTGLSVKETDRNQSLCCFFSIWNLVLTAFLMMYIVEPEYFLRMRYPLLARMTLLEEGVVQIEGPVRIKNGLSANSTNLHLAGTLLVKQIDSAASSAGRGDGEGKQLEPMPVMV